MKKVHGSTNLKSNLLRSVRKLSAARPADDIFAASRFNSFHKPPVVGKPLLATCSAGMVALLVVMLLGSSVWAAAPASSAPDNSDYEIPLGELKKVKKERPVKKYKKVRNRKKAAGAVPPLIEQGGPTEKKVQTPVTDVPSSDVLPESRPQSVSEKTSNGILNKTEIVQIPMSPVTIHHDPHSYVITGKRTTIQAVVSSSDSIQTVYCRFRAAESGTYATVPMVQVPGTHFTYSATVPGLAAASRSLRYGIIAIDSLGHEARSQEFIIAVKPSAVLPGWQLDNPLEMIKIKLENREKPFEGFSDAGIVVE